MTNKQQLSTVILTRPAVFEYLKEKCGTRKTKTEAYCDLLEKAASNFISPFMRDRGISVGPNQCVVTITDLATAWHWHRATVRSFLERLEALGQLEQHKLPKCVVITMPISLSDSL